MSSYNYNNNHNPQPPYNYQQPSNGPPPPPWQSDQNRRTGWHDPRYGTPQQQQQQQSQQQSQQQPQPQSPSASYQPSSFGHISGQPLPPPPQYPPPQQTAFYSPPPSQYNHDTSGWGVKYNQGQQAPTAAAQAWPSPDHKPVLPPRPSSRIQEEPASSVTSSWNRPALVPQADGTWQFPHLIPQSSKPPTPPPRPPISVMQTHFPQGSQSFLPAQPSYPSWNSGPTYAAPHVPQIQTHEVPAPSWNQSSHVSEGTISPIEDDRKSFSLAGKSDTVSVAGRSDTVSPMPGHRYHPSKTSTSSIAVSNLPGASVSASALGPDWQHYSYSDGSADTRQDDVRPLVQPTTTTTTSVRPQTPQRAPSKPPRPSQPFALQTMDAAGPSSPVAAAAAKPTDKVTRVDYAEASTQSPVHSSPERPAMQNWGTDSDDALSSPSGLKRTGTIDSVIHAWSGPMDTGIKTQAVPEVVVQPTTPTPAPPVEVTQPKIETADHECQTDFPPDIRTETKIETRVETRVETNEVEVEVDPYADIKNEYSATLKRFASMLRQEAQADSDEDKFKIFQGFVIRELRLRSVLYGVDALPVEKTKTIDPPATEIKNATETSAQSTNPLASVSGVERVPSASSKAMPVKETTEAIATATTIANESTPSPLPPASTTRPHTPLQVPSLSIPDRASPSPKDEAFVVVNADGHDEDDDYSPGGRPRMIHKRSQTNSGNVVTSAVAAISTSAPPTKDNALPVSPGTNAPMTLDDYVMPDQPDSPANDAPIVVTAEDLAHRQGISPLTATLTAPLNFQPPRPTYTPFRQGDRPVSPLPPLKEHDPTETYNSVRQAQAAESGRMLSNDLAAPMSSPPSRELTKTSSGGRHEHEEVFIGLIRRESKAIRKKPSTALEQPAQLRAGTPLPSTPSPGAVTPLARTVRTVRQVVPKTLMSEASANPCLEPITTGLSRTPDDFGFIKSTVVSWDQENKKIRTRLDHERSKRQTKNEKRIDELFNDNEIGYADIGALEAEFNLDEASKKYQEDQEELDSFVKAVYDRVVKRMETELGELDKLQKKAADLLESHSQGAGRRIQSISDGKSDSRQVPMTELMDLILQLHGKAEIRHQKIAEAQFERERRRKRLESSVLYTNGDTAAVKRLEQEFNEAQLRHVADEARKRDDRANRLMDAIDRPFVRGLAENQAWIDEVQAQFQILRDSVVDPVDGSLEDKERDALFYGADGINPIISQTQSALDLVQADSQKLVKLWNIADKILNEADYGTFLADERLAKAPGDRFEKLKQDKIKEDDKIREEYEAKISGVDKAPLGLMELLRAVKAAVGGDEGHKARLGRALEEAKKRNERVRGDSVSSPVLVGGE